MKSIPKRIVERMVKAGHVPVIRGERPGQYHVAFVESLAVSVRCDEVAYRVARAAEDRAANPPWWARR